MRETDSRIRIIGGIWRGRKLQFLPSVGLRPTSDRVRETLVNWLRDDLPGAVCLDLFAGSGALSFEALSRGAAKAFLVESSPKVALQLRAQVSTFNANAEVICQDALGFLASAPPFPVQIHFLDPPFQQGLSIVALEHLAHYGWMTNSQAIYIETERDHKPYFAPAGWEIHRTMQTQQVYCCLLRPK